MSGMVRLGLQDCQKHRHLFLPPGVVLPVPGWEGTPDHSLLKQARWRKEVEIQKQIRSIYGGVQLEKMSISY